MCPETVKEAELTRQVLYPSNCLYIHISRWIDSTSRKVGHTFLVNLVKLVSFFIFIVCNVLCFDDSFAHFCHSLSQPHDLEWFTNYFNVGPRDLEKLMAACHIPTHLKWIYIG